MSDRVLSTFAGLAFLLVFAVSQAVRDAFFASTFQSVSFFFVAILAFGMSTVAFGGWAWRTRPDEIRILARNIVPFLLLNATTAAAWLLFFFALKNLEPAIVNTLYTGVGPIAVLALSALGVSMAKSGTTGTAERLSYAGVLASLIAVAAVSLFGQSGLSGPEAGIRHAGVACAVIGGVLITVSHMIARRLGDLGVGSAAMMGLRFPLTLAIAVACEFALGEPGMRPGAEALPPLALAAFALIVIPSFFLQLGIARAAPLTVNIMRALGPVFVFAAQQFDGRIQFSGVSLAAILAFVFFATSSILLRIRSDTSTEQQRNILS